VDKSYGSWSARGLPPTTFAVLTRNVERNNWTCLYVRTMPAKKFWPSLGRMNKIEYVLILHFL
jgi:hypothetical protein